jgi:hypothetical protein
MDKSRKAQAILELAVFGAILIMLLGVLVNYGLRYNFAQKAMISAFRKALAESAKKNEQDEEINNGQASYTLIQDKHIPNPANPFAVGSVGPAMSSASVVRTCRLHETADWKFTGEDQNPHPEELPKTIIQIQDHEPYYSYKTAAFREEEVQYPSDEEQAEVSPIDKYKEVYGDTNVWYKEICSDTPDESGATTTTCTGATVRVIDSCEGEIINYDACKRQCRLITNEDYCEKECNRDNIPGSEKQKNCSAICEQQMNTPWYCKTSPTNEDKIVLDDIFAFANIYYNNELIEGVRKPRAMGVQVAHQQQNETKNSLTKEEQGAKITTIDKINWSDTTFRDLIYNDHISSSDPNQNGVAREEINIMGTKSPDPTYRIPSTVGEDVTLENCETKEQ